MMIRYSDEHSLNAHSWIRSNPSRSSTFTNCVHDKNAHLPISLTVEGMLMCWSNVHTVNAGNLNPKAANALHPILSNPSFSSTFTNPVQPKNAVRGIALTLDGMLYADASSRCAIPKCRLINALQPLLQIDIDQLRATAKCFLTNHFYSWWNANALKRCAVTKGPLINDLQPITQLDM